MKIKIAITVNTGNEPKAIVMGMIDMGLRIANAALATGFSLREWIGQDWKVERIELIETSEK